jgi:hypothetical protein
MKEDILRIMKMVEEGKIDTDKASELIEAIKTSEGNERTVPANYNEKMLKVRVSGGEDKVVVNLPIKVIKSIGGAIKSIPAMKQYADIDIQAILEAISNGLEGEIVNVTSANGETVTICIE